MEILNKIYWDFEQISGKLWKFVSSFKIFKYILDKIVKNFRNISVEFIDIQRKYLIKFANNFGNFSENFVKIWANFRQKLWRS